MSPYTDEPFEDDDEVAVLHGPREQGFRALSEAMVNVRATLAAATDAGVIAPATRDALAGVAKRLFRRFLLHGRAQLVGDCRSKLNQMAVFFPCFAHKKQHYAENFVVSHDGYAQSTF